MLIRAEQIEVLQQSLLDDFLGNLEAHLKEFFPEQCAEMGDEALDETIQYGVEVAQSYGLTTAHAFCVYLDLMFLFGEDFDQDPQHPWAADVLSDPSFAAQEQLVEALWDEATLALSEEEEMS